MKLTIDTTTPHPTIEKGEQKVTWGKLSYAERMELLAKLANVYKYLSERIGK